MMKKIMKMIIMLMMRVWMKMMIKIMMKMIKKMMMMMMMMMMMKTRMKIPQLPGTQFVHARVSYFHDDCRQLVLINLSFVNIWNWEHDSISDIKNFQFLPCVFSIILSASLICLFLAPSLWAAISSRLWHNLHFTAFFAHW